MKKMTITEFAKSGGNAKKRKYGLDVFSEMGKKGGEVNKAKGPEYFSNLSKLGVAARQSKSGQ